jgi:hypothetical protein
VSKRLGWNKNVGEHPKAADLLKRHRATMPLPPLDTPDVRPFNGPIADQGQAGSCVGFAGGRQLGLFWRAMGMTSEWIFPSPRLSYPLAMLQEYAGTKPELIPKLGDNGCMPALYLQAIRNAGFVRWELFPYPTDAATLNNADLMTKLVTRHPPADVMAEAYDQKGLEYGLYDGEPADRIEWIKECLIHRMAPTFGMLVDESYMYNTGETVKKIDLANVLGGHDQCIVAVDNYDGVVVAGSWGKGFGYKGFVVLSPDIINDPDICSDFQIVKAAPLPEPEEAA